MMRINNMKILITIIAYIYIYCIMPIIDVGFMAVQWLQWIRIPIEDRVDLEIKFMLYMVYPELYRKDFSYKWDPFNGYLNYNWLLPFQVMLNDFEGDCDKAATMYKWAIPGGSRHAIIFKDDNKLFGWFAHVVYATENKVYDQTQVYDVGIERYKEVLYKKAIIIKLPY
jgi:hypothetical protein